MSALLFTRLHLNKSFFVGPGPAPDCRLVDGLDIQSGSGAEVLTNYYLEYSVIKYKINTKATLTSGNGGTEFDEVAAVALEMRLAVRIEEVGY